MRKAVFHPTLHRDKRGFSYSLLSGVHDVRLDGEIIRGQFDSKLVERVGNPRGRLIEQFMNWPADPENVLLFTKENGPLDDVATPGSKFSFEVHSFKLAQVYFNEMWREPEKFPECPMDGGNARFSGGVALFHPGNLKSFLHIDLQASEPERLRVCKAEGCSHPYFIAGDLKRRFCSVECSEEGRRELKREWWLENGQDWVAKRRAAGKEGAK